MSKLWAKIAGGALIVITLMAAVMYIQHVTTENARLTMERDSALASEASALKALSALQRAAQERIADNTRIDTAEKGLRDDIAKIERAIEKGEPVAPDAYARAIDCSRLRRTGQVSSAAYRARC